MAGARRPAHLAGRSGRAAEGHPVFQPDPPGDRPVAPGACCATACRSCWRACPNPSGAADLEELRRLSHTPATNIVNLIYESKHRERYSKDYEFGTEAMREHWESGLSDIRLTLARPGVLDRPTEDSCFVAHDIHRNGKRH